MTPSFFESLLITILNRPYVFAFLISFLVIGILNRGLYRTLLFLVLGFSIAYLSEFSSIRNGFPYGYYTYVYENMPGELIYGGIPLWDSLSYSFLAYAAYEYACFFLPRHQSRPWFPALATLAMVLIDVVVDPLAVRGERWFLGKIFYYPTYGPYFGVTIENFLGWIGVGLAILYSFHLLQRKFSALPPERYPWLGPAFYWGILIFNLLITFWIGEWLLALLGIFWHVGFLYGLRKLSAHFHQNQKM